VLVPRSDPSATMTKTEIEDGLRTVIDFVKHNLFAVNHSKALESLNQIIVDSKCGLELSMEKTSDKNEMWRISVLLEHIVLARTQDKYQARRKLTRGRGFGLAIKGALAALQMKTADQLIAGKLQY
jgi:hypothetical protein